MSVSDFGEWHDMESAPRDGRRVLVAVRATEQGPAEVDMARWGKPEADGEERWISVDSDPAIPVFYSDVELNSWMPLPSPAPELRAGRSGAGRSAKRDTSQGSGI